MCITLKSDQNISIGTFWYDLMSNQKDLKFLSGHHVCS